MVAFRNLYVSFFAQMLQVVVPLLWCALNSHGLANLVLIKSCRIACGRPLIHSEDLITVIVTKRLTYTADRYTLDGGRNVLA